MAHAFMAEMELVVVRISVDLGCRYTKVRIVEKILNRTEKMGDIYAWANPTFANSRARFSSKLHL